MIEFMLGLIIGYALSGDVGEPVPSQVITYSDSGKVIKVYRSGFHGHRYYPNALAIGWNTTDYRYWKPQPVITPVYSKSVVIKRKPKKPSGEYRGRKGGNKKDGKGKKK